MPFIKADEMPKPMRFGETRETDDEVRTRIQAALTAAAQRAGATSIEVKGLKGRHTIIGELMAAGYKVTWPYRDNGATAEISWRT